MGKRGPQRTPTAVLEARESWRAKTRGGEPKRIGCAVKPDWLQGVASDKWDEIVPLLEAMRVLAATDSDILALYCRTFARYQEALAQTSALFVTTETGRIVKHPCVSITEKALEQMLRCGRELGLTPAARTSLSTDGPQKARKPAGPKDTTAKFKINGRPAG